MKVYVVEAGVFDSAYIAGVYESAEAAKAAWSATGPDGWVDQGEGQWWNGLEWQSHVTIQEFEVKS